MSLRLRPHHLLCMLTYVGKGYSPEFVAGFDQVVDRLAAGEVITIVEGPDDICEPLLRTEAMPHCLDASVQARDAQAARDLAALFGRTFDAGDCFELDDDALHRSREAFASGATRAACVGCQWSGLCSEVAAGGYVESALRRAAASTSPSMQSSADASPSSRISK